jgi:hypothetical protein
MDETVAGAESLDEHSNHPGSAKSADDDDATTLQGSFNDAMSDWSETGRGTHIEFDNNELVPLKEGL